MATETKQETLWGETPYGSPINIRVLGITGPYQSGKSFFGCSIAPGKNEDGEARTKVFDLEHSCTDYQALGFDYVDLMSEINHLIPDRKITHLDLFSFWRKSVLAIDAGQYEVIYTDPINDLEKGLAEYVASRHADYGYKSAESFRRTKGIFWGAVKSEWKLLLADISSRCKTFAFSVHLRKEVVGDEITGRDKAAGLASLTEISSLFLWLSREDGREVPRCERKLKDRLVHIDPETYQPTAILPPAFDGCTPQKIRDFITKPANYSRLKKDEKVQEPKDDEIVIAALKAKAAESEAETERLRSEREERRLSLQHLEEKVAAKDASGDEQRRDKEAEEKNKKMVSQSEEKSRLVNTTPGDEKSSSNLGPGEPMLSSGKVTPEMVADLLVLFDRTGMDRSRLRAATAKRTPKGTDNPMDLSLESFKDMWDRLEEKARLQEEEQAKN